jgi:hypothetical protein
LALDVRRVSWSVGAAKTAHAIARTTMREDFMLTVGKKYFLVRRSGRNELLTVILETKWEWIVAEMIDGTEMESVYILFGRE